MSRAAAVTPLPPPPVLDADLKKLMRALKLGRMLDTLPERLALAKQQSLPYADFLSLVFADEVERRDRHAERPGFRISELQLSPTQTVPWHFHTNISDTFYVLQGKMRLFLQNPKQEVRLAVGESFVAVAGRPHLVTNAGDTSLTFLILQGVGEYDYVPLV